MTRRPLVLALFALSATVACHSWQASDLATGVGPAVAGSSEVRVTRTDRSRLVVELPRVEGDSLTGQGANAPSRIAMAVGDVQRVETRRFSVGRTALVVAAGLASVALFSDSPSR